MKLLALDASTDACSVALLIDDEVYAQHEHAPRRHGHVVLGMVDALLAQAGLRLPQLDALVLSRGPGAFTGLRLVCGVVQGLALGADLPVVPVSSLAVLAYGAYREYHAEHIAAALDARMGEVYFAAYTLHHGSMQEIGTECVCRPDQVPLPPGTVWLGVGSGFGAYASVLADRFGAALQATDAERYPHAQDAALLGKLGFLRGEALPADLALPVYLRNEVAWKKTGK